MEHPRIPTLADIAATGDRDQLEKLWIACRDNVDFLSGPEIAGKLASKALGFGDLLLAREILNSYSQKIVPAHPLAHLKARILVQSGNTDAARELLLEKIKHGAPTCDEICLLARTHKDDWLRGGGERCLRSAIETYFRAYRDFVAVEPGIAAFPAVNAATLCLLSGRPEEAQDWARRTLELEDAARRDPRQAPWVEPMLGEACLVSGNWSAARDHYEKCLSLPLRDRATARKQARFLLNGLGKSPCGLDEVFKLPTVVVFSGHMVDAEDRPRPRFPAEVEADVSKAIEDKLREVRAGIGYSSAAAGSDILFAEAMLRLQGEIHIHLSGPRSDFQHRSVDYAGGEWAARFAKVLAASRNKVDDSPEHQPSDASLGYAYCNTKLSGIAGMRAAELNLDLIPLAVYDGAVGDGIGGTADFVGFWNDFKTCRDGFSTSAGIRILPQEIHSNEILLRQAPAWGSLGIPRRRPAKGPGTAGVEIQSMQQDLKALLFADVKGFSKIPEIDLPVFFKRYMSILSRMINEAVAPPVISETWGDAIYMVFDEVAHAGNFALAMRREMSPPPNGLLDAAALGLGHSLDIRIALHAGPVFHLVDPITRRISFTGRHVSQAARLEPVTEPGEVFCSEAFAALSWTSRSAEYKCEFVGNKILAKDYGRLRIFRLCPSSPLSQ